MHVRAADPQHHDEDAEHGQQDSCLVANPEHSGKYYRASSGRQ
jgi:hypothetical protein